MESHFYGKLHNPYHAIISYELIPPPMNVSDSEKIAYAKCAAEVLLHSPVPIHVLNLPEIRDEKHLNHIKRPQEFLSKMDNREFALLLYEQLPHHIDYLINHCTVYESWEEQKHWLIETWQKYKLNNLILVGGDSSQIVYPGPSVTEFAQFIKKEKNPLFLLGGITIPSRIYTNPQRSEACRLIEKTKAQLDYFTSQIIYEAKPVKQLLQEYNHLCNKFGMKPKRIFLSLAPITHAKDVDFLTWLGVHLSEESRAYLLSSPIGIGWRSLNKCREIIQDILSFIENEDIKVPIGLNIEHISQHNFEMSCIFINDLGAMYLHYMTHQAKRNR